MVHNINLSKISEDQQTEELCLKAVQKNPWQIAHVKNQTPEICITAVNLDGKALQFIENQTDKICLTAVQQDGCALKYVKSQTPEICLAAVNQSPKALLYVDNKTEELCIVAVKKEGLLLILIEDQTENVCLAAISSKPSVIRYCKIVNDEIILKALSCPDFDADGFSIAIRSHDCFLSKKIKLLYNSYYKYSPDENCPEVDEFEINPLKFCADFISDQPFEYVVDLKNKIPEVFENNIYLMSVYEKMLLEQNISKKIKNTKSKNKAF